MHSKKSLILKLPTNCRHSSRNIKVKPVKQYHVNFELNVNEHYAVNEYRVEIKTIWLHYARFSVTLQWKLSRNLEPSCHSVRTALLEGNMNITYSKSRNQKISQQVCITRLQKRAVHRRKSQKRRERLQNLHCGCGCRCDRESVGTGKDFFAHKFWLHRKTSNVACTFHRCGLPEDLPTNIRSKSELFKKTGKSWGWKWRWSKIFQFQELGNSTKRKDPWTMLS